MTTERNTHTGYPGEIPHSSLNTKLKNLPDIKNTLPVRKKKIRLTLNFSSETLKLEESECGLQISQQREPKAPEYSAHQFSGQKVSVGTRDFTGFIAHTSHLWKMLRAANNKCSRTDTSAWRKRHTAQGTMRSTEACSHPAPSSPS